MGRGKDGGRDATYMGKICFRDGAGTVLNEWDGYTVVQAKFHETPSSRPQENATWLWGQIKSELDEWTRYDSPRGRLPSNLLFVTNVELSAVQDTGGHYTIRRHLEGYRATYEEDKYDYVDENLDEGLTSAERRLEPADDPDDIAAEITERGGRELRLDWDDLPWRHFADTSGNEFCLLPAAP